MGSSPPCDRAYGGGSPSEVARHSGSLGTVLFVWHRWLHRGCESNRWWSKRSPSSPFSRASLGCPARPSVRARPFPPHSVQLHSALRVRRQVRRAMRDFGALAAPTDVCSAVSGASRDG